MVLSRAAAGEPAFVALLAQLGGEERFIARLRRSARAARSLRGGAPTSGEAPGSRPPPGSPQAIVADGYDVIAERYLAWSGARPSGPRRAALELALAAIPLGAEVLELGCGSGRPMTAALAEGRP